VTAYLESSAAVKLLIEEAESAALAAHLDGLVAGGARVASSFILETELRRFAIRAELPQARVTEVLERLDLLEPDRAAYRDAGLLPGRSLRSLDALHVIGALRLEAETMISYDARQVAAARDAGLQVVSPV
jgi:uncharacterized protein